MRFTHLRENNPCQIGVFWQAVTLSSAHQGYASPIECCRTVIALFNERSIHRHLI